MFVLLALLSIHWVLFIGVRALSSEWSLISGLIRVAFYPCGLSSVVSSHQDGLLSLWSLIRVVSSGWSFTLMVYHQSGLSSDSETLLYFIVLVLVLDFSKAKLFVFLFAVLDFSNAKSQMSGKPKLVSMSYD